MELSRRPPQRREGFRCLSKGLVGIAQVDFVVAAGCVLVDLDAELGGKAQERREALVDFEPRWGQTGHSLNRELLAYSASWYRLSKPRPKPVLQYDVDSLGSSCAAKCFLGIVLGSANDRRAALPVGIAVMMPFEKTKSPGFDRKSMMLRSCV
jgi:hypothetical protein